MSTQLIIHEGPKCVCINEYEKDTAKKESNDTGDRASPNFSPKNVTQMLFLMCLSYRS